jgi:Zinc-finger of the MIZ type in Nse subunit
MQQQHLSPAMSLADTVLRNFGSKETQYLEGTKVTHTLLKSATERLRNIETLLLSSSSSSSSLVPNENNNIKEKLDEQKNKIRSIAECNVQQEKYVQAFCHAIQTVRDQMHRTDNVFATSNDALLPFDFQNAIDGAMAFHGVDDDGNGTTTTNGLIPLSEQDKHENESYRAIMHALGDPKPTTQQQLTASGRKKKRRSGGGNGGEDDDDEIEVMRNVDTQPANSGAMGAAPTTNHHQHLKCPISREFMMDAVRNKVCHHIYSRAGIMAHIQQSGGRPTKCPVFGCSNRSVAVSQLDDDIETTMNAKREVRRQDQRKQLQKEASAAANSLVDTDEE